MALIECKKFGFTYPNSSVQALQSITLSIQSGEFVVMCGHTGSGKTTLLQSLKKEIAPIGNKEGSILYGGKTLESIPSKISTQEIGVVFQDPESQIVMDTVIQELAFTLENFGFSSLEIKKRIYEMAQYFGLEYLLYTPMKELSGGQKQIVNICSVLLHKPKLLLLDEPTSQLDPIAAHELIQLLYRINQDFSTTMIVSEHRLQHVFSKADRLLVLEDGKLVQDVTPKEFLLKVDCTKLNKQACMLPAEIYMLLAMQQKHIGKVITPPLTVKDCKKQWKDIIQSRIAIDSTIGSITPKCSTASKDQLPVLCIKELDYQYSNQKHPVLYNFSFEVFSGECFAILGGNGTGKTTLLQIVAGMLKPTRGKVYFGKKPLEKFSRQERRQIIGYVAQNPKVHFMSDTVMNEMLGMIQPSDFHLKEVKIKQILQTMELESVIDQHPYDLSGGQQQKLAIALALLGNPKVLLLDEPTKGLDPMTKINVAKVLQELQQKGIAIIMATHDIEFAAMYVDRCAFLMNGECLTQGTPTECFSENYFYTTSVNRVVREELPSAIHIEDVFQACTERNSM